MRKIYAIAVLCFLPYFLLGQTTKTVNITAGNLWSSVTLNEKQSITIFTITGTMDVRDFKQLKDSFPNLTSLNLNNVSVVNYNGIGANTIPNNTFANNTLLTTFVLPQNITTIEANAFSGCTSVTAINFPASLVNIDATSFRNFGGLFSVDTNNAKFSTNNGILYNKPQTELIQCPISVAGSPALPVSLTTIKAYAFLNCSKITGIVISNTNTLTVEDHAFWGCSALNSFDTRAATTIIGTSSFENCTKLSVFKASNMKTGSRSFLNCTGLTNLDTSIIELNNNSFYNCVALSSVKLTTPMTTIPDGAFYACRSLTSVDLPASVNGLGSSAFAACSKLVTLSATSVALGVSAFSGCSSLKNIEGIITAIGNSTFVGCSKLESINVSSTITTIGGMAFNGCITLPNFTVPQAVSAIGEGAFRNCSALINVASGNVNYSSENGVLYNKSRTDLIQSPISKSNEFIIPEGTATLKAYSFLNNTKLTTLVLPKTLCTIESTALLNCPAKLIIDKDNPCLYSSDSLVIFNGDSTVLIYCSVSKKGSYILPNSVDSIANYAFYGCNQLTSVIMNTGLSHIGVNAFTGSSITVIDIPSTVISLGEAAFTNCTKAGIINIPASLKTISKNAFNGCKNAKTISISDAVSRIEEGAFGGCSGWEGSLHLPTSISFIGKNAFNGCSGLTGVLEIPSTITSISYGAFANCTRFADVKIPPSTTTIEGYAFYNCTGFKKITIPATVSIIGSVAFGGCTNLTSLYADAAQPVDLTASASVFYNINKKKCTLFVPAGSKKYYQAASQWKDFYHIIEGLGFWIDRDTVRLPGVASSDSIIIGSNTTWTTTVLNPTLSPWLSSIPQTGNLDGRINIYAEENVGDERRGYIEVKTQDSKDTIVVVQAHTTKVPDFEIVVKSLKECGLQTYEFTAKRLNNPNGSFTYTWNFGDGQTLSDTKNKTNHTYENFYSQTYNISLTVSLGAYQRNFERKFITDTLPEVMLDNKPYLCQGDTMIVHARGADSYQWSNGSTSDSIIITRAGKYTVKGIKNDTLCMVKSFTVEYFSLYDYVVETGNERIKSYLPLIHVWVNDISGSDYVWQFADGGTAKGDDVYYLLSNTDDNYSFIKLEVTNPDGCKQIFNKLIQIEKSELPNTFTPNGDGVNDVFLAGQQLKVFDRFGQLLYDGLAGWDGLYKGKKMPRDTYFYVITFKTQAGLKNISNYVMLIR